MPHFGQLPGLSLSTPVAHRAEIFVRRFARSRGRRGPVGRMMFAAAARLSVLLLVLVISNELVAAMRRTEIDLLSVPLDHRGGCLRLNFHPADGIDKCLSGGTHPKNLPSAVFSSANSSSGFIGLLLECAVPVP